MIAAETATATWNWYDIFVGLMLVYGVWSGTRNGLFGELLRVIGLAAMVGAAMKFYVPVGDWFRQAMKIPEEPARLTAFVVIAIAVYLPALWVRNFVHGRMKKMKFGAVIENVGGALAGVVRMTVVMVCLTILISLTRSPFWHEQVSTNSRFGEAVVARFPDVAAVVKKKFPEKLWFTRDIQRPDDPSVEETGTTSSSQ